MQKPLPFLNKKRLLAYPYLIFIPLWLVTLINVVFSKNWYGLFGGFIGYDFLAFYSGGRLFWTDTSNLYNEAVLAKLQSQISGIPETGLNFFPHPPYNGMLFGLFSFMAYPTALVVWTVLSIACITASVWLIHRFILPKKVIEAGVSLPYLLVLVLSFYPVMFGLQNGQDHFIFLLLFTLAVVFTIKKREYSAGVSAAFLLIKPQLAIGWLILWLLMKHYKAIIAFAITGAGIVAAPIVFKGITPYIDYVHYLPIVSRMFQTGHAWAITPVAIVDRLSIYLFGTANPMLFSLIFIIGLVAGLILMVRKTPRTPDVVLILFSLLIPLFSFHNLLYDLVLVIPLFAVWSQCSSSRLMLLSIIGIYLSGLILPILSDSLDFPIMGILPLFLVAAIAIDLGFVSLARKRGQLSQAG